MDKAYYLYVSSTARKSRTDLNPGIDIFRLDPQSSTVTHVDHLALGVNCNTSCIDHSRGILYVTGEESSPERARTYGSRIVTFDIDKETGHITERCVTPVGSPNPAFICMDAQKQHLIVANHTTHNFVYKIRRDENGRPVTVLDYDDATVCLFDLREDGTPGELLDVAIQEGSGPLKTQTHAHPHSAVMSPDGQLVAVCDKGADKIFMYRIDSDNQRLTLACPPYTATAGNEPRFCAFHPTKPYFYANHEGDLDVDAFSYDQSGHLALLQTVSAFPLGTPTPAGRVYENQGFSIHPSGKYLYSVTRGVDGIAVFSIDDATGQLTLIQHCPINSSWPRCCQITPDGQWLVAGTRENNCLLLYKIAEDGFLDLRQQIPWDYEVAFISIL